MEASLAANYAGVFDGRVGLGAAPALVVVDLTNAYCTPGSPFFAPGVVDAVRETVALLDAARRSKIPVVHTRVEYAAGGVDGGRFVQKVPALRKLVAGEPLAHIVDDLRPLDDEVVLVKQYPSAFFATPLAPMLTALGVDTVIVAGCSTSGCVRATVVDGCSHGFRVVVPRECVGDRHAAPHEANLFDIHSKYGDVVPRADVLAYLDGLLAASPTQKRASSSSAASSA